MSGSYGLVLKQVVRKVIITQPSNLAKNSIFPCVSLKQSSKDCAKAIVFSFPAVNKNLFGGRKPLAVGLPKG